MQSGPVGIRVNALAHKLNFAWRAIGTILGFCGFGLACIVLSLSLFPLIRLTSPDEASSRRRIRRTIHYGCRCVLWIWRTLGILSLEIHGRGNLHGEGQLVVANHPTLIDVLFIFALVPDIDCIVKRSLLRNPVLRWPILWAHYIPAGTPQRLIEDCTRAISSGRSLVVFPEGTRSVPGQPLALKRGAAHIALATGCDVVPVSIACQPCTLNKADKWHRIPASPPHWRLKIGRPIRTESFLQHGEGPALAARRLTQHLADLFTAGIGKRAERPGETRETLSSDVPIDTRKRRYATQPIVGTGSEFH